MVALDGSGARLGSSSPCSEVVKERPPAAPASDRVGPHGLRPGRM